MSKKFSQEYFKKEQLIADSERFRRRLANFIIRLVGEGIFDSPHHLVRRLKMEIGLEIKSDIYYSFEKIFQDMEIKDLLDSITVIYEGLKYKSNKQSLNGVHTTWQEFVNECFLEEGLYYILDDDGSVRYKVDEEFEQNRSYTDLALDEESLQAAKTTFKKAYDYFLKDKHHKSALREIFEANEILFRKITGSGCLSSKEIMHANNILSKGIEKDESEKVAINNLISSFKEWVNAVHQYRHGQKIDQYVEPSYDITVLALSNGASFLRWLITIYKAKNNVAK